MVLIQDNLHDNVLTSQIFTTKTAAAAADLQCANAVLIEKTESASTFASEQPDTTTGEETTTIETTEPANTAESNVTDALTTTTAESDERNVITTSSDESAGKGLP